MDKINSNMFESEEIILASAEELIRSDIYKDDPLIGHFENLAENYKRVLKEIKKIIRISDGQQEYLHKIQVELKQEIERRISVERQLSILATTDALTGIYNRGTGLSILDNLLKTRKRNNSIFSVCFVDLNGLKYVNDNFGHNEGDELIVTVCRSFQDALRDCDIICRLGGDEFLLVFPESNADGVKAAIERIINTQRYREFQDKKPYEISFSYGIVEVAKETESGLDEIIELADRRMYLHKEEHKKGQNEKR